MAFLQFNVYISKDFYTDLGGIIDLLLVWKGRLRKGNEQARSLQQ